MMHLSQILLWITVGAAIALASLMIFSYFRNLRHRMEDKHYPQPEGFSIENALNEQSEMFQNCLDVQENAANLDRDRHAGTVKDALEKQKAVVKDALEKQKAVVKDALEAQQESVKTEVTTQAEIVGEALTKYQTASKTDLAKETEIVKGVIKETINGEQENG
jgi:hypothetical protein